MRLFTDDLARELADPGSIAARVKGGLESMLRWRSATPSFHPDAAQRVLDTPPGVLGIERGSGPDRARVYINVRSEAATIDWPGEGWSGFEVTPSGATITVGPWSSVWLRKES